MLNMKKVIPLECIKKVAETLKGHYLQPAKEAGNTIYFREVPGDGSPIIAMRFRGDGCSNMIFHYTEENKEIITEFVEGLSKKLKD